MSIWRPQLPVFLQAEVAECGLAALAMIAGFHGHKVDLNGLRQRFGTSAKGTTLVDLIAVAAELGFSARPLRSELRHLPALAHPCILHWELNHFVVLKEMRKDGAAVIHDPATGVRIVDAETLSRCFSGVALELLPAAGFSPKKLSRPLLLSDLWHTITGWKQPLVQVLLLSLLLQALVFASPLMVGIAINDAIGGSDLELLLVIAGALAGMQLLMAASEALRAWVIHLCEQALSVQIGTNLLRHLLRLPVEFFERRIASVIVSRTQSVEPIQHALSQSVVTAVIDGVMAIAAAVMVLLFSPLLAGIVLLSLALYLAFVLLQVPMLHARQQEQIAAQAESLSHLYETVRAARTIKLFAHEWQREITWRQHFTAKQTADRRSAQLELGRQLARSVLFGLQLAAIVYFGAKLVIGNAVTLGGLYTFLLYRAHLCDRSEALARNLLQLRMLRVHLDRVADLVQAEPESEGSPGLNLAPVEGVFELKRVSYRYSANEAPVFSHITFKANRGDFIAIVGPSGGGKTTLLKLMTGLAQPTSGDLLVEGVPIGSYGAREWRKHIGVVQQECELLTGTMADNIAFFDANLNMAKVIECARAAGVHDDIASMPMGYLSVVGDMGAALSGGQRQRVLLARALYRRPNVLFLDEGTANLDAHAERKVADLIASLPMTRVVIAHRPELIRRADRILELRDGFLRPISWEYFASQVDGRAGSDEEIRAVAPSP